MIFVEDTFSKIWVEAIIRQSGGVALDHLQAHAMQGDSAAVGINLHHNKDPSARMPSVCFIDGDFKEVELSETSVFRLPGQAPESFVFDECNAVYCVCPHDHAGDGRQWPDAR